MINMNPIYFLENKPSSRLIINGEYNSFSMDDDKIIIEMEQSLYNYNQGIKQLEILLSTNYKSLYEAEIDVTKSADVVKQSINAIIEFTTKMFTKFFLSVNKLIGRDSRWYQQHKDVILSQDFKLPLQNEKFKQWKDFKIDRLKNSLVNRAFSTTDQNMLKQLDGDGKEFENDIFSRIGGSRGEIDSKITDFKSQCEFLYSGPDKEVNVSDVQNNIKTYFDFCADFLTGKNSSVYNAIINDSKKLDESKKNIDNEIKEYASNLKSSVNQSTTNQASDQSINSAKIGNGSDVSKTEESFDLASYFGLLNIYEAEMPKGDENTSQKEDVENNKLTDIKNKAVKYFKLTGNAIGAQMSAAIKAYSQYNKMFRWAVKKSGKEKEDTTKNNDKDKQQQNQEKENKNTEQKGTGSIAGDAVNGMNK